MQPRVTRASVAAAAALEALRNAPEIRDAEPLFTLEEVLARKRTRDLLDLLSRHRLLHSYTTQRCTHCGNDGLLRVVHDESYTDKVRLQCKCGQNLSIRHGSIAVTTTVSLRSFAEAIVMFNERLDIQQATALLSITSEQTRQIWRTIRMRIHAWMAFHPVQFDESDVIEVDELFVRSLQPDPEEGLPPVWIIGAVARGSNKLALEICRDHTARVVSAALHRHLPATGATIISDEHASFGMLRVRHNYHRVHKEHAGSACWPVPYPLPNLSEGTVWAHTNTIEGAWSNIRVWLHQSRGWSAQYLPLMLTEWMFRSLRLPLSVAIERDPPDPPSREAR